MFLKVTENAFGIMTDLFSCYTLVFFLLYTSLFNFYNWIVMVISVRSI